jgi:hypothetical protein
VRNSSTVSVCKVSLTGQVDQFRWCLDPRYHRRRGPVEVRNAAVSHLSNLMMVCKNFEEYLDNFGLYVDILRPQPISCRLEGWTTRSNVPDDAEMAFTLGSGFFPQTPRDKLQSSQTSLDPDTLPAISRMSLYIHMYSALYASCTNMPPAERLDLSQAAETSTKLNSWLDAQSSFATQVADHNTQSSLSISVNSRQSQASQEVAAEFDYDGQRSEYSHDLETQSHGDESSLGLRNDPLAEEEDEQEFLALYANQRLH